MGTTSAEGAVINDTWRLLKLVGAGGFGEVYSAIHLRSGKTAAVKVATDEEGIEILQFEAKVYKAMRNTRSKIVGVPELKFFQKRRGSAVLVMDLLGPSLLEMLTKFDGKFSLKTTLMVGIQMLRRLQLVHHKGYIHRDVKPENILIGKVDTSRVYLVDYGVSSKYRDYDTRKHMPKKNSHSIIGSIPYISLNAHKGVEQTRRDDLESLGYTLVYLFTGTLPWQEVEVKVMPWQDPENISELTLYNLIEKQKRKTSLETLFKGMPKQMMEYMKYVRRLRFDERPDYSYLRGLLRKGLRDSGFSEDRHFDWSKKLKPRKAAGRQ